MYVYSVHSIDLYSNVLSARLKNKRGMLCMHVLIIRLNKIPIAINPCNVDCSLRILTYQQLHVIALRSNSLRSNERINYLLPIFYKSSHILIR
jgi:hypothetical protein